MSYEPTIEEQKRITLKNLKRHETELKIAESDMRYLDLLIDERIDVEAARKKKKAGVEKRSLVTEIKQLVLTIELTKEGLKKLESKE